MKNNRLSTTRQKRCRRGLGTLQKDAPHQWEARDLESPLGMPPTRGGHEISSPPWGCPPPGGDTRSRVPLGVVFFVLVSGGLEEEIHKLRTEMATCCREAVTGVGVGSQTEEGRDRFDVLIARFEEILNNAPAPGAEWPPVPALRGSRNYRTYRKYRKYRTYKKHEKSYQLTF